MKRHTHILLYTIICFCFFFIFLMVYWSAIDGVYVNRVTSVDSIEYQTNKTSYSVGETVQVSVEGLCKHRDINADSYINLVDTVYYPYEVKHRSVPMGCPLSKNFVAFVELPLNITGRYHLSGYHSYDVNPIRSGDNAIRLYFTSNEFDIKK